MIGTFQIVDEYVARLNYTRWLYKGNLEREKRAAYIAFFQGFINGARDVLALLGSSGLGEYDDSDAAIPTLIAPPLIAANGDIECSPALAEIIVDEKQALIKSEEFNEFFNLKEQLISSKKRVAI